MNATRLFLSIGVIMSAQLLPTNATSVDRAASCEVVLQATREREPIAVTCVDCSPDGLTLLVSSSVMAAHILDAKTLEVKETVHVSGNLSLYGPGGRQIIITGGTGYSSKNVISIIDSATQNVISTMPGASDLCINRSRSVLGVAGRGFESIHLYDLKSLKVIASHTIIEPEIAVIKGIFDSGAVVIAQEGRRIQLWTSPYDKPAALFQSGRSVEAVETSADGKTLAVGINESNGVELWRIDEKTAFRKLDCGSDRGESARVIRFSPDGAYILAMFDNGEAIIWSAKTYEEVARVQAHTGLTIAATWYPDSKHFATGGHKDGMVKLWRIDTKPAK